MSQNFTKILNINNNIPAQL